MHDYNRRDRAMGSLRGPLGDSCSSRHRFWALLEGARGKFAPMDEFYVGDKDRGGGRRHHSLLLWSTLLVQLKCASAGVYLEHPPTLSVLTADGHQFEATDVLRLFGSVNRSSPDGAALLGGMLAPDGGAPIPKLCRTAIRFDRRRS